MLGVTDEGGFRRTGRSHACPPSTVVTEPAGGRHANNIERAGARVVVVQPDPSRVELLRSLRSVLDEVRHFGHAGIAATARRLSRELRRPDDVAGLAVESLALEMLA